MSRLPILRTVPWPHALALVLACSGAVSNPVPASAPSADVALPPPGVADRGDDPAVVAIDFGGALPCAGALLAPDVVLTALHCVVVLDEAAGCGPGAEAGAASLRPPASLRVLVGEDAATAVERARGRDIIAPPSLTLCGADVALLLLDTGIEGVAPLVVRTTGAATGEHVRAAGFAMGSAGLAKRVRDHLAVVAAAATELTVADVFSDGGGDPALDESTAQVLGVASRAGPGAADVFARGDAFLALVQAALRQSRSAPSARTGTEKPKKGPVDMGGACAVAADCAAGVCVSVPPAVARYCSRTCGPYDRCPADFRCKRSTQGVDVCVQT